MYKAMRVVAFTCNSKEKRSGCCCSFPAIYTQGRYRSVFKVENSFTFYYSFKLRKSDHGLKEASTIRHFFIYRAQNNSFIFIRETRYQNF